MTFEQIIAQLDYEIELKRAKVERFLERSEKEGRKSLTAAEHDEYDALINDIKILQGQRASAHREKAYDDEIDAGMNERIETPAGKKLRESQKQTATAHITREPHTYSKDNDREGKGEQFIADVLASYRGNGAATQRLSRHMHEYEVDNPRYVQRAAGDAVASNFPNLVVPQYLVSEYAAVPSNARPFADAMTHRDLPAEGMTVELAVGNTVSTAALQDTELVAPDGTSHDDNALQLAVQTAESWQQVSRQALDRGRVTEQIVMNDLLDGMHALVEDTVLNQGTNGLFAVAQRNEYDSASPTAAELYPLILGAASKSQAVLKNRGKPNFVLLHPRRWYWLQAQMVDTYPAFGQPGVDPQTQGNANTNPYGQSPNGVMPAGLNVVESYSVNTAILDGAATGGTEDSLFVGDTRRALLFEAPNREVFIRAEQPLAKELGLVIVCYQYFAYTYGQYANAFQAVNGTGTIAPTGF